VTADEYWHLHRSDCQNSLIYGHTTSRNLPPCDISLGSLTLPVPESGEFVELLLLCFGEVTESLLPVNRSKMVEFQKQLRPRWRRFKSELLLRNIHNCTVLGGRWHVRNLKVRSVRRGLHWRLEMYWAFSNLSLCQATQTRALRPYAQASSIFLVFTWVCEFVCSCTHDRSASPMFLKYGLSPFIAFGFCNKYNLTYFVMHCFRVRLLSAIMGCTRQGTVVSFMRCLFTCPDFSIIFWVVTFS
jgi:hypothetical protein